MEIAVKVKSLEGEIVEEHVQELQFICEIFSKNNEEGQINREKEENSNVNKADSTQVGIKVECLDDGVKSKNEEQAQEVNEVDCENIKLRQMHREREQHNHSGNSTCVEITENKIKILQNVYDTVIKNNEIRRMHREEEDENINANEDDTTHDEIKIGFLGCDDDGKYEVQAQETKGMGYENDEEKEENNNINEADSNKFIEKNENADGASDDVINEYLRSLGMEHPQNIIEKTDKDSHKNRSEENYVENVGSVEIDVEKQNNDNSGITEVRNQLSTSNKYNDTVDVTENPFKTEEAVERDADIDEDDIIISEDLMIKIRKQIECFEKEVNVDDELFPNSEQAQKEQNTWSLVSSLVPMFKEVAKHDTNVLHALDDMIKNKESYNDGGKSPHDDTFADKMPDEGTVVRELKGSSDFKEEINIQPDLQLPLTIPQQQFTIDNYQADISRPHEHHENSITSHLKHQKSSKSKKSKHKDTPRHRSKSDKNTNKIKSNSRFDDERSKAATHSRQKSFETYAQICELRPDVHNLHEAGPSAFRDKRQTDVSQPQKHHKIQPSTISHSKDLEPHSISREQNKKKSQHKANSKHIVDSKQKTKCVSQFNEERSIDKLNHRPRTSETESHLSSQEQIIKDQQIDTSFNKERCEIKSQSTSHSKIHGSQEHKLKSDSKYKFDPELKTKSEAKWLRSKSHSKHRGQLETKTRSDSTSKPDQNLKSNSRSSLQILLPRLTSKSQRKDKHQSTSKSKFSSSENYFKAKDKLQSKNPEYKTHPIIKSQINSETEIQTPIQFKHEHENNTNAIHKHKFEDVKLKSLDTAAPELKKTKLENYKSLNE